MTAHSTRRACVLLASGCAICIARSSVYSMRETVRIGHKASVQLHMASEGGREVEVVTVSDETTGLPAFRVDSLLSADECAAIRVAAPASMFAKSKVTRDFPLLQALLKSKKRRSRIFNDADNDHDGGIDSAEFLAFLQGETDLVDTNFTELLDQYVGVADAADKIAAGRKLSKKEFLDLDWKKYFDRTSKLHPQWFSRHSSQTWLSYDKHKVLQTLLEKVAAVTGLPEKLVAKAAEPLQLLHYEPHGAHYSCHHDSSPDNKADFRFMTFFIFLNDVADGGETVLFGTDLNGTHPQRSRWGPGAWEGLEPQCQSVSSCPASPGALPPDPFSSALVVKPKLGSVLFWYNTKINEKGEGLKFFWSSIHGGCPTRTEEKWAANVWLHAGPMLKSAFGDRREEL